MLANGLESRAGFWRIGAVCVLALLGFDATSCSSGGGSKRSRLVRIEVTPPGSSLAKGTSGQYQATGIYSNNTSADLTSQVTWSSSDGSIAAVSNGVPPVPAKGTVSGLLVGSATITARLGSITGATVVTVTNAGLVSISIDPPAPSIANGTTQQFTATGLFTDATTQDLTASVTWSSSDEGIATISTALGSQGLASAGAVGSTTITAAFGAISDSTALTVTAATLVSIDVTPADPAIANGTPQQFTATGLFTDTTTQDLTAAVTWSSSDEGVATISSAPGSEGLASSNAAGSTTITATSGGISGSTTLTVTAAALVSIDVTPADPSIASGTTQQFTATGLFTDTTTQDLTSSVIWSSSDEAAATISNALGSEGLASSSAVGSTTITAVSGAISGSTTLTVTAATLLSIDVTPADPSIASGTTQQFTATGTYTDTSTQDLTAAVAWSSSDEGVATISNALGTEGLASSSAVGSTTITAASGGISGSTTLTVTAATLASIGVTPADPSIANGLTQQFTATGILTDNTTQDLTASVTWLSSDEGIATISNAPGSEGLASSSAAGSTTITATSGAISGSTTLTVTAATLASIDVTPVDPSIPDGTDQQFTATGTFTDTSTQDLTAVVTWSSSDEGVATISNALGTEGLASSSSVGSTTIMATSGGISGSTTLTVTAATLVSIQVTPADPSIADGTTQQFTATGTYTDASTQDLTSAATWSSSDEGVATISNAPGSEGLASSSAVGSTTITAVSDGISDSTTLTVTAATLASIDVTPVGPSIPDGTDQQFTATGTYTDTSTQDLTSSVTWLSSDESIATISNAGGSEGLATGSAAGSTTITAVSGAISGSTTLTVTPAVIVTIVVAPDSTSIPLGSTQQFTATAIYTDGSTQDLTSSVTWESSDEGTATISSTGLASTVAEGTGTITATFGGFSNSTGFTVTPVVPPVTVDADADAWIDQNSSTTNKGTDSILKVRSLPSDNFRTLVRFALPAIPDGYEVESATLSLYSPSWQNGRTLEAFRVNAAWSETTVTWANQPPVTGTAATTSSGEGWRQWDVTSQVEDMYSTANHGFLIRDASASGSGEEQQFHSREKGEQTPILVITFSPVGG